METEYATLVANIRHKGISQEISNQQKPTLAPTAPLPDASELPSSQSIYLALCDAIRREQPTGPGLYDDDQIFLASGAAVTHESHPSLHALPGGLIEVATPEVRSPGELLACQRSIDAMIADAAREIDLGDDLDVDLRILKNSSDAFGHVYGCQENYESIVAAGIWLPIYRAFVLLLWMIQIVSLLVSLPVLGGLFVIAKLRRLIQRLFKRSQSNPADTSAQDVFDEAPKWLTALVVLLFRLIHLPTVVILQFVVKHVAFRPQRRYLSAFLYSRVALCGSGLLNHDNCFSMSAKAMAIDTLSDLGGFRGERPVFVHGHWLTQYCAKSFLSLSSTWRMFARRQRLQIGLSDSNMADLAEYVKVGSMSLLLDMIERGHTNDLPRISRNVDPLHRLASDWNLVARIATHQGDFSALEIQNKYLKAADAFVNKTSQHDRGEATVVLQRWRQLYDCVHAFRKDARATQTSLGQVDWLTKHWMMDQLGSGGDWSSRKKIDLRYHELSRDGYFFQLMQHNPELRLVSPEQIQRRRRSPPPDSPAARRAWMIREFSQSEPSPQFDWTHAVIGSGPSRKRIDFSK